MSKTPTEYLEAYQKLHAGEEGFLVNGKKFNQTKHLFDGSNFVNKLYPQFCRVVENFDSVRVLDYGCGKADHLFKPVFEKGTLYQEHPGKIQTYYCYDPGNKIYQTPPARNAMFEVIICADVMEHIPEEMVERTLYDMRLALAPGGAVLFTISGQLAKKSFLDGENLHCSVYPYEHWTSLLSHIFKGAAVYLRYETKEITRIWSTNEFRRFTRAV